MISQYHFLISPFSSFWALRPKYVKKQSQSRPLQYVCDICENEILLNYITASMARDKLEIPAALKKSTYTTDYRIRCLGLSTLCSCTEYRIQCLIRKCDRCGTKEIEQSLHAWLSLSPDSSETWFSWCYKIEWSRTK